MKNFNEMTREDLLETIGSIIEKDKATVEQYSDFEKWTTYFLSTDENVIKVMYDGSIKKIEHYYDCITNGLNSSQIEDYNELMLNYYKQKRELYKPLVEQTEYWETLVSNPDEEAVEYLEELYVEALEIFTECGFKGIWKSDVVLDVTSSERSLAYYSPDNKNIMLRETTLNNYSREQVISIILHEMVHAFVDRHITKDACSDESIIFSAFIFRLNRKLRKLGYNFSVGQNGVLDYYALLLFRKEVRKIADCRKNLLTVIDEAIDVMEVIENDYGTIKVLEGEALERVILDREEVA